MLKLIYSLFFIIFRIRSAILICVLIRSWLDPKYSIYGKWSLWEIVRRDLIPLENSSFTILLYMCATCFVVPSYKSAMAQSKAHNDLYTGVHTGWVRSKRIFPIIAYYKQFSHPKNEFLTPTVASGLQKLYYCNKLLNFLHR